MAKRRSDAEAVWRERLGRFQGSGLTVSAFCQLEGVSTSNFYGWKRRLAGSGESSTRENRSREETPLFVPVAMSPAASTEIRIVLPGGAVVHLPAGADERVLACCIRSAASAQSGEDGTC